MLKKNLKAVTALSLAVSISLPATAALAGDSDPSVLVPLRSTAQSLGAKVDWSQAEQSVTVTKNNQTLIVRLGHKHTVLLNGKEIALRTPVQVKDGSVVIDSEILNQALAGLAVESDPADAFIEALQAGNGSAAASLTAESIAPVLQPALLNGLWSNYEQLFGKVKGQATKTETVNSVHRSVSYTFVTEAAGFQIILRLNEAGKVDDYYINTSLPQDYQKPAYERAGAYTEQEITVGGGALALPGTLTLPAGIDTGTAPFPAVVLVHGSGPQDRDSTIGGAKVFRDLAVGLAAQGIAVLRYDKVTYEHSLKVSLDPTFTLKRETVDDALAAVELLKGMDNIDSSRIYVAGHSQGGYAVPLMIQEDAGKSIAGAIILAGPAGKFADILALQQKELVARVKQIGIDSTPYEQQAAQFIAIADIVNDPQYTTENMPDNFPIQPAFWWFEQKNYTASELAAKQSGPLLILQGENDWQVPAGQFDLWKQALKNRSDAEYKLYPKVNHLLSEYDGLSIGSEYVTPSNVKESIIEDIASWINRVKP
ncbi:alpha/beta hydrolase family protein [Paenibacillus brevis]|uniref:Alpha/beta fold hydrolase n=1 Tax=Paenibacillus brevis TaxID=2841508 RepID=A0ABS6FWT6_9BACL|nr:alpha/beta fold hydrolase [Paenibacillus brevis]MBU5673575.1 alpha/beta fold hydrolase [Paenibacillus brevis]